MNKDFHEMNLWNGIDTVANFVLIQMPPESFNKLLNYIAEDITPNEGMTNLRGGSIIAELCLYATLRWLADSSYLDISFMLEFPKLPSIG